MPGIENIEIALPAGIAPEPVTPAAAPSWIDRAYQLAVRCHSSGMLEEAKQLYIRILQQNPDHAWCLHNLGLLAREGGDQEAARELLRRAVGLGPREAAFHGALATVLTDRKEAEAEFKAAWRRDPRNAEILYNYATFLMQGKEHRRAITRLKRALKINPRHVQAWLNLGCCYEFCGKPDEAEECFRKLIQEQPGTRLAGLAMGNLAKILHARQEKEEAERYLRQAVKDSNNVHLRCNLADLLFYTNRQGEAIAYLEETVRLAPNMADIQIKLAAFYHHQGRLDEAFRLYHRAMYSEGLLPEAQATALFALHYSPIITPKALADIHRRWAQRHVDSLSKPGKRHANKPDPERKLRVGYVSNDFHQHPVAFFMDPVLAAHDPRKIESVCYFAGGEDKWTEKLRSHASVWKPIGTRSERQLAELIERDRIDILIDLAGHCGNNHLPAFAMKPAPVQISWMGYFNTTGVRAMDYLLVDDHLAPPEEEAPFVEEGLRIPGCYLTYRLPDYAPPVAPSPRAANGYTTYGCFNNISKIGFHVISVWCDILRRNPGSRLLLLSTTFADESTCKLYRERFEKEGVSPDRVDLDKELRAHKDLLGLYSQIDLALDPFPYNGGTTTCEALGMGVPVVNLRGDRFVSRVGSTILTNAGFADLVTTTEAEYIDKAVELGQNLTWLAETRANMRIRLAASTLWDTVGFTRRLENVYRDIWRRWCREQQPLG